MPGDDRHTRQPGQAATDRQQGERITTGKRSNRASRTGKGAGKPGGEKHLQTLLKVKTMYYPISAAHNLINTITNNTPSTLPGVS